MEWGLAMQAASTGGAACDDIAWKVGFEVELLVPKGASRLDLARRVAAGRGGSVARFFHPQSEPSQAEGSPTFENLTLGFEARDSSGHAVARFVDDLTLQADLDRAAGAKSCWYRIVTDDARLLRLILRHCDPDAPLEQVLLPLAGLFGTLPERHPSGMVKVVDDRGVSVAIAAPLPGERERACELVTPPLDREQGAHLAALLNAARDAGCTLPREGATHIHFDGAALTSAPAIATLVAILDAHGAALKAMLGSNPHCIRLGRWPEALSKLVATPGFAALDWPAARRALSGVGLSKYCDFNLLNIAAADRAKHTFELRVLPAMLEPEPILAAAALFAALLHWCGQARSAPRPVPPRLPDLLACLDLPAVALDHWCVLWRTCVPNEGDSVAMRGLG